MWLLLATFIISLLQRIMTYNVKKIVHKQIYYEPIQYKKNKIKMAEKPLGSGATVSIG